MKTKKKKINTLNDRGRERETKNNLFGMNFRDNRPGT